MCIRKGLYYYRSYDYTSKNVNEYHAYKCDIIDETIKSYKIKLLDFLPNNLHKYGDVFWVHKKNIQLLTGHECIFAPIKKIKDFWWENM